MDLCLAAPADRQGLTDLWMQVFGDSPQAVKCFFDSFPCCRSYAAKEAGTVAAMVHAIERTLTPRHKAAYLYAVATAPAFRGQGLCRSLMAFAEADLKARGYDCCILRPASSGLFRFYEGQGYETAFFRSHNAFPGGEPISAAEYIRLREEILTVPHTVCDETLLNYASSVYGLTFYRTETGCCAASPHYTAECLPEDVGGGAYAMIKWLTAPSPMDSAYLGFALE